MPCTRSAHDQKLGTFRQRSIAINLVELHQSIGVALIMLGDIPKAVACAGNVDGHGRLLGIFAPGSEMLKGDKFTSFTDSYLDDSVHIDLDLPAVDGVDPEVLDSGAREQIGFLQSFW